MIEMRKCFLLLPFIIVAACNLENNNDNVKMQNGDTLWLIKQYDENGIMRYEKWVDKDSLVQDVATLYYEDGKVKSHTNFKDNKKHGEEKGYYNSGKLKYIGFNYNGIQDSTTIFYFENGIVEEIIYKINGKTIGEWKKNHTNGKIRKLLFSYDGKVFYIRTYDENGNVIKEEGRIPVAIGFGNLELNSGEILHLDVNVGLLPEWDASLEIKDITNNKYEIIKKVDNRDGFSQEPWGKVCVIEQPVFNLGNNKWAISVNITDENDKTMQFLDTLIFKVIK